MVTIRHSITGDCICNLLAHHVSSGASRGYEKVATWFSLVQQEYVLQADGTITPLNNTHNYVLSEQQAGEILAQVFWRFSTLHQRNREELTGTFPFSGTFPTEAAAAPEEIPDTFQGCRAAALVPAASGDPHPRLRHHASSDSYSASSCRQFWHLHSAPLQARFPSSFCGRGLQGTPGSPGEWCSEIRAEVGPRHPRCEPAAAPAANRPGGHPPL